MARPRPEVVALCLALFWTPLAAAEAWPRGPGKAYVHLGVASSSTDDYRRPDGELVPFPGRDNREERLNLYAELGLSPSLTLILNVPYKSVRTRGLVSTFESRSLADLDARLRWSIPAGSSWLAVEGGAFIPLGYDADDFPPLGSGKTDGILNLAFGTSLRRLPEGFLSVDLGYRIRGGDIHDEIPWAFKVGAFPHGRIGTFAFARGWRSLADFSAVDPNFGLVSSDSEKTAAGLELYFRLTRRLDANVAWTTTIQGRNIVDGDEFGIGLAWKID